jgi:hypothetical protein
MMSYDAQDGYVLLFGGANRSPSEVYGTTWSYSRGNWTELHPAQAPVALDDAAMSYDPADQCVVLFGGAIGGNVTVDSGQTWTYRGGAWTNRTTTTHPSSRINAAMTFDGADGYLLLFGGYDGANATYLNDTWEYSAGSWSMITPAEVPEARMQAAMCYDPSDGYVLLFGGLEPNGYQSDSWRYLSGNWAPIATATRQTLRGLTSMEYDPGDGYVFQFGGWSGDEAWNDSWVYHGGYWNELSTSIAPMARFGTMMGADSEDQDLLLFGGNGNHTSPTNDTWAWGAPAVTLNESSPSTDLGGSVVFQLSAWSPAGDERVSWYSDPILGCRTPIGATLECRPSVVGNFSLTATATDRQGAWSQVHLLYEVHGDPTIGVPRASPDHVDAGQPVDLTVQATGGSGSYTYHWEGLPSSCKGPVGPSPQCVFPLPGQYSVNVSATDSNGFSTPTNGSVTVHVGPALLSPETPLASPLSVDVGQNVTFSTLGVGGTGVYPAYSWSGLGMGACTNTTTYEVSCEADRAGVYNVTARAEDSSGAYSPSSATLRFTVWNSLGLSSVLASPSVIDLGQSVKFSVTPSGGASVITFLWTSLPPGCSGENASTVRCTPTSTGSFRAAVKARDSNGGLAIASPCSLIVNAPPTILTVQHSPSNISVGDSVAITPSVSGGTAPFTFSYLGLPDGCLSANNSTLRCRPSESGSFNVTVTVTDIVRGTGSAHLELLVLPAFISPSPRPSPSTSGFYVEVGVGAVALAALMFAALLYRGRRRTGEGKLP